MSRGDTKEPPIEMRPGSGWSDEVREAVYDLVVNRGRVPGSPALRENLANAKRLAVVFRDRIIVATGTVKVPQEGYRDRITRKSGVEVCAIDSELGYIAVHPDYEDRGLGRFICNNLLNGLSPPVFATTNNSKMKGMLERRGFAEMGKGWDSVNPKFPDPIRLYLKTSSSDIPAI